MLKEYGGAPAFHGLAMRIAAAALMLTCSWCAHAQVSIPGQFSVAESGAATYSIPIEVLPGVAGLAPQLSLNYSSQAGNGLVGMGWQLGGLSAITRCPRTQSQDGVRGSVNYDINDRFCMDGQRLLLISGTYYGSGGSEYRTELEGYSRIVANGIAGSGPASFTVQTKAGLRLEFGVTSDSRILAHNKPTASVWALNKITDVKGNAMTIAYSGSNSVGVMKPLTIAYAGQSVSFVYDHMPALPPAYVAGSYSTIADRLTKININSGASLVKSYNLSYVIEDDRSRLVKLEVCRDSTCLAPTTFQWETGQKAFNAAGSGDWTGYLGGSTENFTGDFNADGKTDLMSYRGNNVWQVCLSTGSGFNCKNWNGHAGGPQNNIVADFDGDGTSDIAGYTGNGSHVWHVCYSRKTNFECQYKSINMVGVSRSLIGDFNGDGRADVAAWTNDAHTWQICLSTGSDFVCNYKQAVLSPADSVIAADFDGDGRTDLAAWTRSGNSWHVCNSTGDDFSCTYQNAVSRGKADLIVGDFNGDGLADLTGYTGSGKTWEMCLSMGTGFDCRNTEVVEAHVRHLVQGDFDGDGRTDIAGDHGSHVWTVLLGRGHNFVTAGVWSGHDGHYEHNVGGDFNGDGITDMSAYTGSGQTWHVTHSSAISSRLSSVTDGLGRTVAVTYKPLTNSAVYTKGNAAVYPVIDIQAPVHVVSQSRLSNGLGGANATDYNYGELRAEQGSGRGSQGFRWIKSKEVATGIENHVEYRQDWPFTGLASLAETRLARTGNSGLLKRITTTYQQQAGSHSSTKFISANWTVETSWDLNGAAFPTMTTTTVYNNWGDATQVKVATSDGGSVTTNNDYLAASTSGGKWILGRLIKATVTHITP